jgi:hypothetical protein
MYDPKRLNEDRTPPAAKDSPRLRDGWSFDGPAFSPGKCRGCNGEYEYGAEVASFTPTGKDAPTEIWHLECWRRANFDILDAYGKQIKANTRT